MRSDLLASAIIVNCALCAPAMGQRADEGHGVPAPPNAANAVAAPTPAPALAPPAVENIGLPGGAPPVSSSVRPDAVAPASGVSVAVPGASAAPVSPTSLQPTDEQGGPHQVIHAAEEPAPPSDAATMAPDSDHAKVLKHYAVGYFGFTNIPFGALQDLALTEPAEGSGRFARAPIVGLRYWATPLWGIDVGVGFTLGDGSQKASTATGSTSSRAALLPRGAALHVGAPVAVKSGKHYVFEIIPEMDLAYATLTIPNESRGSDSVHSGLHLDAGGRAGAEIHFGFLGLPELSLTGSVGVRADFNHLKTQDRSAQTTVTDDRMLFRSTLGSEPWDVFTGNVSAFYYL